MNPKLKQKFISFENFILSISDWTMKTPIMFVIVHRAPGSSSNLDGITLASRNNVRNLGVSFDQDLSFNSHVKQISRTAYFHLCNIAKFLHILSQQGTEKLMKN